MLFRMGGKRPAPLLFAAAALLLVVVAARGASPVPSSINDISLDRGLPPMKLPNTGTGTGPITSPADPELLGKAVVALLIAMIVLAVVLSLLSFLRKRQLRLRAGHVGEAAEGTVDTVPRLRLREAVTQARDILARAGGAPRDAVIEAWVTLENAAEHKRAPHETPTEFTVALLERADADEAALRELRTLYQRARFGTGDRP
jgi:hypothetical protein